MDYRFVILFAIAILLFGCSVNPQDSVLKVPVNSTPIVSPSNSSITPVTPVPSNSTTVTLTLEEIAKHNTRSDCWMAIHGTVLDLSSYMMHPGGDTYVPYCGTDATVAFDTKGGVGRTHSQMATRQFAMYTLGQLNQTITLPSGGMMR